jgi:AcrR family transcriptional regulator
MANRGTRRPAEERRQEIVEAAVALADTVGLDRVTSRDVAAELGVASGLIHHYFPTVDDLVTAAFEQTAQTQHDEDERACRDLSPVDALQALVLRALDMATPAARIWMSAWVAAPRRPELSERVEKRMRAGLDLLADLLRRGHHAGVFQVPEPAVSALRILVLLDGVLVQTSMRSGTAYGDVHTLVWDTVEREVGLTRGRLRPDRANSP